MGLNLRNSQKLLYSEIFSVKQQLLSDFTLTYPCVVFMSQLFCIFAILKSSILVIATRRRENTFELHQALNPAIHLGHLDVLENLFIPTVVKHVYTNKDKQSIYQSSWALLNRPSVPWYTYMGPIPKIWMGLKLTHEYKICHQCQTKSCV